MKTNEIIEDNKLIAEFMGATYITAKQPNPYWENVPDNGQYLDTKRLKYHSSWDWLMPVVEKIQEVVGDNEELFETDMFESLINTIPYANIEDSFKVVIEFIKWYNTENHE